MKKISRSLLVATLAALMVAGTQVVSFANVAPPQSESSTVSSAASSVESSIAESSQALEAPSENPNNTDRTATPEKVSNPDTGVSAAPIAAALLAVAALPVMLASRKK